jgi:hypothetical protein
MRLTRGAPFAMIFACALTRAAGAASPDETSAAPSSSSPASPASPASPGAPRAPGAAPEAQTLFDEAERLLDQGRAREACPKLAESQRLEPAPGTLFHLADCYERIGRTASAWAAFVAVASMAQAAGREQHEALARKRSAALEPKLTRLAVVVDAADRGRAGLDLRRDDVAVGAASVGVPVPVDPGVHSIAASASGMRAWRTNVDVSAEGQTVTVRVPALEPTPRAGGDGGRGRGTPQRIAAVALGVLGAASIGVGSYLGLHAVSLKDDASPHCRDIGCDSVGVDLRDRAFDAGTASTVAFVAGGVLLAASVVVWLTAPSSRTRASAALALRPVF